VLNTRPLVQQSSSTIPRCSHGVYFPQSFIDKGEPNYACQFCNPNANAVNEVSARKFVMPSAGLPLTGDDGKLRANAGLTPGECPKCRSRIHYVSDRTSRVWICADCGNEFSAAKGRE
jgi:transposase-like protein